jgi:hypothetical protein
MRIYTILINNEPISEAYTSFSALCDAHNVPYSSATHGKREFLIAGKAVKIIEYQLIKIKGRGRKV